MKFPDTFSKEFQKLLLAHGIAEDETEHIAKRVMMFLATIPPDLRSTYERDCDDARDCAIALDYMHLRRAKETE